TGKIVPAKIKGLLDMGVKPIYKLTTEDGRTIRTTGNHPYLTKQGWAKVANLKEGEMIAVPKEDLFAPFGDQNNNSESDGQESTENIEIGHNVVDVHSYFVANKLNPQKNIDKIKPVKIIGKLIDSVASGPMNIEAKNTCPISRQISESVSNLGENKLATIYSQYNNAESDVKREKIASIEYVGEEQVYDIEVEGTHNFVAGHFVEVSAKNKKPAITADSSEFRDDPINSDLASVCSLADIKNLSSAWNAENQKIPPDARFFDAESSGVEPHSEKEFSRYQLGATTAWRYSPSVSAFPLYQSSNKKQSQENLGTAFGNSLNAVPQTDTYYQYTQPQDSVNSLDVDNPKYAQWTKATQGVVLSDSEGSRVNVNKLQNAKWTKVAKLFEGDEIAALDENYESV
ncbi:MAG: hypothetical protein COT61_04145, partial [Candidatus Portnoybacteria bacterium CG09_land_8_20_14_0_10_44_13]